EQRRRRNPDIENLGAACEQAFQKRAMNAVAAQTAIAAEANRAPAVPDQISAERTAQQLYFWIQQFLVRNAANIVFAKNTGCQHKKLEQFLPPHHEALQIFAIEVIAETDFIAQRDGALLGYFNRRDDNVALPITHAGRYVARQ